MTNLSPGQADIAHLRSWIGREEKASDVVTVELVRKFRATFDLPGGAPQPGEVAPRLIHFCLGQAAAATAALGADGHPQKGGFLPPVPLPRRMWAGGSTSFHHELRVGDMVRRVSRIEDVALKEGSTGLLYFVTVAHLVDANGTPVLSEIQTIVYRGLDSGGSEKTAAPAEAGRWRYRVDPSAPLLFRYSALTFNGHRIHYDRPYATGVEHYPGLVVHAPLQATLLLNYATEIRGTPPTRFSFRSFSPLFDNDPFWLNAEEDGGTLKLWTARESASLAMTAQAEWA